MSLSGSRPGVVSGMARRVLALGLGAALAATASATITVVDDSGTARDGKVGYWSSIVVGNGRAAISYYCEDDHAGPGGDMYALRFAWNHGGGWQWTTLDSPAGSDTSMGLGSDGLYRIAYESWAGLGFATGSATNWTISSVPIPAGVAPANISMVLDNNDRPHIVYMNLANGGDRSLRYVFHDGSGWVPGGQNQGIVGTGLWTPTIGFSNTQLALDAAGVPHIAFAQPSDAINAYGPMQYATLVGGRNGTWQREPLGVMGEDPSLKIGSDNVPRMAFNSDAGIVYAFRSGGTWTFETIVDAQWGSSVSMALNSANEPSVTFGMTANEDMYLAQRGPAGWTVTRFDGDQSNGPHEILGRYGTSIAIDEAGQPHVSYLAIDIYGLTHRADLRYFGDLGPAPCIVFTSNPAPTAVCDGGTATFAASAAGNGAPAYQWRRDGVELLDGPTGLGSVISGATTSQLTIDGVSAADVGLYDCVATIDGCGTVTSSAAGLSLAAPATITTGPVSTSACTGATAQFSASAAGDGVIVFEWWKDGVKLNDGSSGSGSIIAGAGTPLLTISNVSAADQGDYVCMVRNDCGGDASPPATLTVTTCGEVRGDMNCDGIVNNFDIDPFVLALSNPDAYEAAFPNCDGMSHGDVNDDGALNNFDIDPFVVCITLGGCP